MLVYIYKHNAQLKAIQKKHINIARMSLTFCTLQYTWPVKQFPAHFVHAENKSKNRQRLQVDGCQVAERLNREQ